MNKNCDNCYWEYFENKFCAFEEHKPVESVCKKHDFSCDECEGDTAVYEYNDTHYCEDCILKEFDVTESTEVHYFMDGEYLGNSENMNLVIQAINKNIKTID